MELFQIICYIGLCYLFFRVFMLLVQPKTVTKFTGDLKNGSHENDDVIVKTSDSQKVDKVLRKMPRSYLVPNNSMTIIDKYTGDVYIGQDLVDAIKILKKENKNINEELGGLKRKS